MPSTTVDLRQVDRGLRRMLRAGADMRPVWRQVRGPFRAAQKKHIDAKEDSQGRAWKPLAPSTLRKRLSKGGAAKKFTKNGKRMRKKYQRRMGTILSKRMTSRARIKVAPDFIQLSGSGSSRSWIHQHGGRAGRRGRSRIPKREYIYVDGPTLKLSIRLMRDHVTGAFNGKR